MKRRKLLSLFSVLAFVLSVQFSVLGASGPGAEDAPADMSGTALNAQEREAFHRNVADDEAFIHLVTTAAEHKGRDVSLEGVHPDKCLKLYGLKRSEQSLIESLCGVYGETGKIESLFSDDYGVLVLYVNENDEYVDSFVFTRKENLPGAQDKNGWVPLGSGSLTADEDFLAQYSKDGDLSKYITGLGLKNTSRLILTTAIPYLPTCIYFVQENEEFLLPLEDGRAGIQGLQVYRVSDIVETFLMPILNYQDELAEKYADLDPMDIPLGDPPVPDDLPMQAAVDLNTYFAAGQTERHTAEKSGGPRALPSGHDDAGEAADLGRTAETAAVATPKLKTDDISWIPVTIACAAVLLTVGGIGYRVWRIKRRRG